MDTLRFVHLGLDLDPPRFTPTPPLALRVVRRYSAPHCQREGPQALTETRSRHQRSAPISEAVWSQTTRVSLQYRTWSSTIQKSCPVSAYWYPLNLIITNVLRRHLMSLTSRSATSDPVLPSDGVYKDVWIGSHHDADIQNDLIILALAPFGNPPSHPNCWSCYEGPSIYPYSVRALSQTF